MIAVSVGVFMVEFVDDLPHDPLAEGQKFSLVGNAGGRRHTDLGKMCLDRLSAKGVNGADVCAGDTDELVLQMPIPGVSGDGLV